MGPCYVLTKFNNYIEIDNKTVNLPYWDITEKYFDSDIQFVEYLKLIKNENNTDCWSYAYWNKKFAYEALVNLNYEQINKNKEKMEELFI